MNRIVFDTNVLISAIHFGGLPRQILLAAVERKFLLFISEEILAELSGILSKKFQYPSLWVQEVHNAVSRFCVLVTPKTTVSQINNQPGDNRILECALEARAHYLVTGDKQHLLPLKKFRGIEIVTPATFLEVFRRSYY